MITQAEINAARREIWRFMASLSGDYAEVPFEQIDQRPRYIGLADVLTLAAVAALGAARDERRRIQPEFKLDEPKP